MDHETRLHVIYSDSGLVLSRRRYSEWQEMTDVHGPFKAALGPWLPGRICEYLAAEHEDLDPPAAQQVDALLSGVEDFRLLTFSNSES